MVKRELMDAIKKAIANGAEITIIIRTGDANGIVFNTYVEDYEYSEDEAVLYYDKDVYSLDLTEVDYSDEFKTGYDCIGDSSIITIVF